MKQRILVSQVKLNFALEWKEGHKIGINDLKRTEFLPEKNRGWLMHSSDHLQLKIAKLTSALYTCQIYLHTFYIVFEGFEETKI